MKKAKKAPEFFCRRPIYQISLRAFTPEGTIAAATDKLPFIASLGVGMVYLIPHFLADDDTRQKYWSPRQKKSGFNNPKNPYRLKDLFTTDPEYGTDDDMKAFVTRAHELGLRVMFDLVYYSCGPTAKLIELDKDFVKRTDRGTFKLGFWNRPELNFESRKLREYLIGNMLYLLKEFNVDGFRCDIEDTVPLDFWEEARRAVAKVNPDIVMIAGSARPDSQIAAFDANYLFDWPSMIRQVLNGERAASWLGSIYNIALAKLPMESRLVVANENHDVVSDAGPKRLDAVYPNELIDACFVAQFMMPGVPMLYNGNEIADSTWQDILSKHEDHMIIDWSKEMTIPGQRRLELIRHLVSMRIASEALSHGNVVFLDSDLPHGVLAFTRTAPYAETFLVVVNLSKSSMRFAVSIPFSRIPNNESLTLASRDARIVSLTNNIATIRMGGYGFLVAKLADE